MLDVEQELTVIAGFIGKAAANHTLKRIAAKGADGLVDMMERLADEDDVKLTQKDLKTIKGLITGSNRVFQKAWAGIWPPSSGAICVGPSGSGKTSIEHFFSKNRLILPSDSTSETKKGKVRHGAWSYHMTDTPGQHQFSELRQEAFSAIRDGDEKILMLIFSAGFLRTLGLVDKDGNEIKFKRPDCEPKESLEDYLSHALDEEIHWLETAENEIRSVGKKKPFKYLMVVVNKMDQWDEIHEHVVSFYEGMPRKSAKDDNENVLSQHLTPDRSQKFRRALKRIAEAWCARGLSPTFHYVASQYDSFYDNPPSGFMSQAAVEMSLRLLRAEVRTRFLEW